MVGLLRFCNRHDGWLRLALLLVGGLPALNLGVGYYRGDLGFNPFETLMATTGQWGMGFLLVTLAVTPSRRWLAFLCRKLRASFGKRLADWNFLVRARRMLGLFSFFYICLHLVSYLHLELLWTWSIFLEELQERPFIALGLLGWVGLLLLAVTSPIAVRRAMGKRWRQLHRLIYVISVVALVHVWWLSKVGDALPYIYTLLLLILLGHRLVVRYSRVFYRPDDRGLEVHRP